MYSSRQLAEILRETMRNVEQNSDISPDDPSLLALKRIILLRFAKLESEDLTEAAGNTSVIPPEPPSDSN